MTGLERWGVFSILLVLALNILFVWAIIHFILKFW